MIEEFEKVYRELKVLNEKSSAWKGTDINQIKKNDDILEEARERFENKCGDNFTIDS